MTVTMSMAEYQRLKQFEEDDKARKSEWMKDTPNRERANADAKLGALVRMMPPNLFIVKTPNMGWSARYAPKCKHKIKARGGFHSFMSETPECAVSGALETLWINGIIEGDEPPCGDT